MQVLFAKTPSRSFISRARHTQHAAHRTSRQATQVIGGRSLAQQTMPLFVNVPQPPPPPPPPADANVGGDVPSSPEMSMLMSAKSLPSLPSTPSFGSRSGMHRRQFEQLERVAQRKIDKEVEEQYRREVIARRQADVLEFEERRRQAYAQEAARRQTERDNNHKAVRDRVASEEEKRQQSLTNLQHEIYARFDAAARRAASQSQEAQQQSRKRSSRHQEVREHWRHSTIANDSMRSRLLQERWEAKQRMLASRGGEEARQKEEKAHDRMKQQAAMRAAAEQIQARAMNALMAEARERELRCEARDERMATKAREQARVSAEANALAAQRRKAQAEYEAREREELKEAMQAKESRIKSQLRDLEARRREAANENARKERQQDAKFCELRRQNQEKEAARAQQFIAKSQAEDQRVEALRKLQARKIEEHRRANELLAQQRHAHQQRFYQLTRSFSASQPLSRARTAS